MYPHSPGRQVQFVWRNQILTKLHQIPEIAAVHWRAARSENMQEMHPTSLANAGEACGLQHSIINMKVPPNYMPDRPTKEAQE